MIKRIKQTASQRIKRTNFKALVFFLILSCIVWLFVQFSMEYEKQYAFPLSYINVPKDKVIKTSNLDTLNIRIKESGFKLSWISLVNKNLDIDASKLDQFGDVLLFDAKIYTPLIAEALTVASQDIVLLTQQAQLPYDQKETKMLPVKSGLIIAFAPGFETPGVTFSPDSIKVSGSKETLDTISALYTEKLVFEDVAESLTASVPINTKNLLDVTLYQNEVAYTINVDKFTEGKIKVPIDIINVPDDASISIFPKNAVITYQVNLAEFNNVNTENFKISCDFAKRKEGNLMLLEISAQPEIVRQTRLNINKVEYILKQ
ncbi:YbbR-like domain-containing protein [Gangjinia marincola]